MIGHIGTTTGNSTMLAIKKKLLKMRSKNGTKVTSKDLVGVRGSKDPSGVATYASITLLLPDLVENAALPWQGAIART